MIKNKKILYIANTYRFFNHFHQTLIAQLRESGNVVHVAGDHRGETENCDVYFGLRMNRNPLALTNIQAYNQLKKILLENDYDIIHAHTPLGGMLARLLKIFHGKKIKPIIYTAHGLHFYKGASFINWLVYYPIEKILSFKTNTLILINQEDYNLVKRKKFHSKYIVYIPGVGIHRERFQKKDPKHVRDLRESYGYCDDDIILSFIGELNKNKNQSLLIDTMEIMIKDNPNYKLLLVGDGKRMDEYQTIISHKNLNHCIMFLGYSRKIDEIVQITDIALSSSLREGLPVNLMEQAAAGNPIVATNCRGNRDIVCDCETGFLSDFNKEDFAKQIQRIANDPALYTRFSERSKEIAIQFDYHNLNMKYIEVYERVIKYEEN